MERFDYGALEPDQKWRCDCVRDGVDHLRKVIEQNLIDGPEKAIAMQKLEECLMWADRGIADGSKCCATCRYRRVHEGSRFPSGPEWAGRLYCIVKGDGMQGEWVEPDGSCPKWKEREDDEQGAQVR